MSRKISANLAYLLLLLTISINLFGSFYWIYHNIVLVGHDASGYLDTSLAYMQFSDSVTPQNLFQAFTFHDYRPPALFIIVQPFLQIFGGSMDSAQYANILLLGAVIGLTYFLGERVASRPIGLFAALMVGFLPMMTAMARLFYTEMLLTAAVTLNLLSLYRSNAFANRRWSLVWGISLGVGLLTKWTMPIYIGLPVLWVLWKSGYARLQLDALRSLSLNWRRALIALLIGLGLSLFWFWPNRALIQPFPLSNAMLFVWATLLALLAYSLMSHSSIVSNWWLGALLGMVIASLWYLPHADFISILLQEDQTRGQASSGLFSPASHLSYLKYIYRYHFGALAFWLIVPAAIWPWLRALWQRRSLNNSAGLLWLGLLSAYLVLVIIAQRNPRNLTPLLPSVTILATIAMWSYARSVRIALAVIWVTILILQWSIFTFDAFADIYNRTAQLWVIEDYSVQPSSNATDPGYWIGPDVLSKITEDSPSGERLGMLVNTPQLHRGALRYLIINGEQDIDVKALTKSGSEGWYDLISTQWVLVKDGDNRNVEEPGKSLVTRILDGDTLFHALYDLETQYSLPNGDTVYLYHRTLGPGRPHDLPLQLEQTKVVANTIVEAWSPTAHLVYANPDLAVWVGIHDPAASRVSVVDENEKDIAAVLSPLFGTLLIVLDHNANDVQAWLDQHAYRTYEVGDDFASVAIYGRPAQELLDIPVQAGWPDIRISTLQSVESVTPGEVLPIEITTEGDQIGETKLSVRMVNDTGDVIASHDRPLLSSDQFGLFVPPTTLPGLYRVEMVRYNPDNGEIIPTTEGEEQAILMDVIAVQ